MIKDEYRQSSKVSARMNVVARRTPEQTRSEILAAAWDLFRQLGARTTIADIAEKLGMSSANIYRFFPSKQALTEAICVNQLGALIDAARAASEGAGSAAERIGATIATLHHAMRDQMLNQSRVHEIVDVAMNEQWPAIDEFHQRCTEIIARLIAEGQARGEFGPGDPAMLGMQTLIACAATYHPTLIAQCPEPDVGMRPEDIVAFALRALANQSPDQAPPAPTTGETAP
ncbi:MAG: TetR/AcrR family transcriptional regulator [Roseiarcus sp.]|jgi:AcrR family transcriptional regulator